MPTIQNGGIRLHYEVHGTGHPVLLLHGATVSFALNYVMSGWVGAMNAHGLQVIGLDFRGHGASDKPHEAAAYSTVALASDAMAVLDHLGVAQAAVVGYSMGTPVTLQLLQSAPERFTRAALVATGDGLIGVPPRTFARVLPPLGRVAQSPVYPAELPSSLAAYWNFIEQTRGDRAAFVALSQGQFPAITPAEAGAIRTPTLVVSGELDPVLGTGPQTAHALADGEYLEIPGADHFVLAGDPVVQAAVGRFLSQTA